jgi:cyclic pyranopterin phosphate synthase
MLRFVDFLRLVEVFAWLGVKKVRITGGEPLVRKGVVRFISNVRAISSIEWLALTTNGVMLGKMAAELKAAGLNGLNVSLDTLDGDKFRAVTGHDGLAAVLNGIEAALSEGFDSVKINAVAMRGVNDGEIGAFIDLARMKNVEVRFIEYMPVSADDWDQYKFIPMAEVKKIAEKYCDLEPAERARWGGPAEVYRLDGGSGRLGFISAVSRHFCSECNRLRVTSSGKMMTCLFGGEALDFRPFLSSGASMEEIARAVAAALRDKNAVRTMFGPSRAKPFSMASVGG